MRPTPPAPVYGPVPVYRRVTVPVYRPVAVPQYEAAPDVAYGAADYGYDEAPVPPPVPVRAAASFGFADGISPFCGLFCGCN